MVLDKGWHARRGMWASRNQNTEYQQGVFCTVDLFIRPVDSSKIERFLSMLSQWKTQESNRSRDRSAHSTATS